MGGGWSCRHRLCRWSSSKEVSGSHGLPAPFMVGWKRSTDFDLFCLFRVISSYLFVVGRMICHPLIPGAVWMIWRSSTPFFRNAPLWRQLGRAFFPSNEKANFPVKFCDPMHSLLKPIPLACGSFYGDVIHITQQEALGSFVISFTYISSHHEKELKASFVHRKKTPQTTSDWSVCSEITKGRWGHQHSPRNCHHPPGGANCIYSQCSLIIQANLWNWKHLSTVIPELLFSKETEFKLYY